MKRRSFIKNIGGTSALIAAGSFPVDLLAAPEIVKLTILHTNDVHSRIEPFPADGGQYAGMGGAARRAALIREVRKAESNVLLFDCGDIIQGTPYFNKFGGELEFRLMNEMQYDAATLGNHDFDAGMETLEKHVLNAQFPLLTANYDFSDTILDAKTKPCQIFEKAGLRIGVFGVGIMLQGLVPEVLCAGTRYLDPVECANNTARFLKEEESCDYVICLSHLGYTYEYDKVSDVALARRSQYIDLILGGHTHTFLKRPGELENMAGKPVLINQAGWGGILLGRLDVYFEKNKRGKCVSCKNLLIK